jgi:hypothetical protein
MLRTGVYLGSGCENRFCIENLGILAMEHDPKRQRFADAIQALVMRFSDRKTLPRPMLHRMRPQSALRWLIFRLTVLH